VRNLTSGLSRNYKKQLVRRMKEWFDAGLLLAGRGLLGLLGAGRFAARKAFATRRGTRKDNTINWGNNFCYIYKGSRRACRTRRNRVFDFKRLEARVSLVRFQA
jgi:hypothetical protein